MDVSGLKVPAVSVYVFPVAFIIKLPVKVTIAPPDLFIIKSLPKYPVADDGVPEVFVIEALLLPDICSMDVPPLDMLLEGFMILPATKIVLLLNE